MDDNMLTSELHDRGKIDNRDLTTRRTIPLRPAGIPAVALRAAVRMIAEKAQQQDGRKSTENETR